jgi:hypothetical protein
MAREMVWIKRIERWGCSDSAWAFDPSGPPVGNSIDEMGGISSRNGTRNLLPTHASGNQEPERKNADSQRKLNDSR